MTCAPPHPTTTATIHPHILEQRRPQSVYVWQTPRLNRKGQETVTGDSECRPTSAGPLSVDQACRCPSERISQTLQHAKRLQVTAHGPEHCGWRRCSSACRCEWTRSHVCVMCTPGSGAFICVVMCACISKCGNSQDNPGRRQTLHCPCRPLCELLRQKNKYGRRRRGAESESVRSQGAAEQSRDR